MLYSLTGTVRRLTIPQAVLDVNGVGYLVSVPHPVWQKLEDGSRPTLTIYTYVREDRLDLYGFLRPEERSLFTELLNISGIGPKLALELCSIPMQVLIRAVQRSDSATLTSIKGIGKKTAEKLLVDLKSLLEKHPEWASAHTSAGDKSLAAFDSDAIAALTSLGYDQNTVLDALKRIPARVQKTEERVAAALRSL